MVDKRAKLAEEIRALQGQSDPIDVAGKTYVFKKLRRRDCQETLYDLVKPMIKVISTVIEKSGIEAGDLHDMDKIAKAVMENIALVGDIFDAISYDKIHRIAQKILKDVIVNNSIAPDDFENPDADEPGYYDDKQLELIQALIKGIKVNYPFIGSLIKKKGESKEDSDQKSKTTTTG